MVTTGRTLDADGQPIPGTGFELDPDGELAGILARRVGALASHPTRSVWTALLPESEENPDTLRSVGIFGPGFDGPPEHYHIRSEERFAVVGGTVRFRIDGRTERVTAGETITVRPYERHSFTVEGDEPCYMLVDIDSPGRLRHVLPTLSGLAHDEAMDSDTPLQQVIIAQQLSENTVFTELDPRLTRPLCSVLAPIARLRGYQGAYDKYTRETFWERHVEQPAL
ncbi:MAG: cupin domain-containing protein [Halohasta sp.]